MEKTKPNVFYTTYPTPCPYLPDQTERKLFMRLNSENAFAANILSRAGFRRTQNICYLPACPECNACISVRIPVQKFIPTKKQKKTWRQNGDLSLFITPNVATEEQYGLFKTYLDVRHPDGGMNSMDEEDFRAMIEDSPVPAFLLEARDSESGVLQGVMLADIFDDGLSAVYSFFNPDEPKRSLGTFLVLELVRQAKSFNLPYVYLGYYIAECPNMAYKARFFPLEKFENDVWSPL